MKIENCPNPKCKSPCEIYYTDKFDSEDKKEYWQVCCFGDGYTSCWYEGPRCLSEQEAVDLHNTICGATSPEGTQTKCNLDCANYEGAMEEVYILVEELMRLLEGKTTQIRVYEWIKSNFPKELERYKQEN